MKWYWWLLIIVVAYVTFNYFYKQKNGRNFITVTSYPKANEGKMCKLPQSPGEADSRDGIIVEGKCTELNIPKNSGCSNLQLAAPPPGKQWTCVNGDWILTDKS